MLIKVGLRGQITIPKQLRQALGVKPGDSLAVTQVNGELLLQPITKTIFDFVGSVPVVGEPQDLESFRKKARQHVAQKVMKELNDDA